jgi:hypothetical protein
MTKAAKELNEIIRSARLSLRRRPATVSSGSRASDGDRSNVLQLRSRSSMALSTRLSTVGHETASVSHHSIGLEPLLSAIGSF